MIKLQRQLLYGHKCIVNVNNLFLAVLEYCWALVVVLNGNSVYSASADRNYHLMELCVGMTVVLLLANLLLGKIRIKKRNLRIAVVLCLYMMIYFVIMFNNMQAMNFLFLFVMGLPCVFLLFAEMHRKGRLVGLWYRVANVVCIFAMVSLFFWVFGTMLGILKPNMTARINWGNFENVRGYWGLHFQFQRETTFGSLIYRNSGIFAEAPMLNLWCNIALGTEMLLKEKPSKKKVVILLATIITTVSATGFLFIALCFGLRYLKDLRKRKVLGKLLLVLGALIVVPIEIHALYNLLILKSQTTSFLMRMSDYLGGLKMWMDYPIFGGGYGNLGLMFKYIYSPNGVVGFSNSLTAIPATGGLWMTIPFYYGHLGSMFSHLTHSKQISMFCVCLFYLFCTTSYFGRFLAVVMIAFGMAVLSESRYAPKTKLAVN